MKKPLLFELATTNHYREAYREIEQKTISIRRGT
mgnify:CR=1 FL=1